jgi:hypothetical protein
LRSFKGQRRAGCLVDENPRSVNGSRVARPELPAMGVVACVCKLPRPSIAEATEGTCHPEFPDGLNEL